MLDARIDGGANCTRTAHAHRARACRAARGRGVRATTTDSKRPYVEVT